MDPDTVPALDPPDGQLPNFTNPPTLMVPVTVTCILVFILPTLFIIIRIFTKSRLSAGHHIEDWLSYFAWAGLITYTSILYYIEQYGFARHQYDLSITQFSHVLYYINILYCIYGPTTLAAKLSVLFQIKRIFTTGVRDAVYWVTITSIVANTIFYTALFFSYVFQCWPRERIWNSNVPGHCVSATSSNLAAGILNLISDLEALALPAWAIWHLRMPVKRKLTAFAVFSIGSVACIIGIVGIYLRVVVLENADFTWLCTQAALLVISEIAVVIIVGCTPILPRFYFYVRHKLTGEESAKLRNIPQRHPYTYPAEKYEKKRTLGSLGHTMAKYMSPRGARGLTTLPSHDEEKCQLKTYVEAGNSLHTNGTIASSADGHGQTGIWTTTSFQQQTTGNRQDSMTATQNS
ncbi:hypothetical protein F4777DRAFT_373669 [Nemania sp. FL0916]|nr:hypothetical protein F4777DRAFT_373669 [Nemania sp. FL0916]